jgi:hypothetical protein
MGTHTWKLYARRPRIETGEDIVTVLDVSNDIIITQVWQWEKRTTDLQAPSLTSLWCRTGPQAPNATVLACASAFAVTALVHHRQYTRVLRGHNVRIGCGLRGG